MIGSILAGLDRSTVASSLKVTIAEEDRRFSFYRGCRSNESHNPWFIFRLLCDTELLNRRFWPPNGARSRGSKKPVPA